MSNIKNLNAALFAQLDRMKADTLKGDDLKDEISRTHAIVNLADQITSNHRTALDAARLFAAHGKQVLPMLPQIGNTEEDDQK